jgi:hypothetical protein
MRERAVRVLLVGLGAPAVVIGTWAAFAPRSFYEDFPGFGQTWVRPDGPFNEHLVRDVGELNLALAFVTLAAAVWCAPLLVRVVAGAWLVEAIPHLVYHLGHLDPLASDARVPSIAGLAMVPVFALVLLAMTIDRGASRGRERPEPETVPTIGHPPPPDSRGSATLGVAEPRQFEVDEAGVGSAAAAPSLPRKKTTIRLTTPTSRSRRAESGIWLGSLLGSLRSA